MARPSHVCFGTFGETIGVGVHSGEWWVMPATDVVLSGTAPLWLSLRDSVQEATDIAWIRNAMPTGLQLDPSAAVAQQIGFVAARVEERESGTADVAYPFLFAVREGHAFLGFSDVGPPASIRSTIVHAFGKRLLAGAV